MVHLHSREHLSGLTILFIAGFFAVGFFELWMAFATRGMSNWGWLGVRHNRCAAWHMAVRHARAEAANVLVWVVGFYVFFYSAMGIGEACQMRKFRVGSWGWMLFFSILGVLCSFLFLVSPVFGAVYLSWLVGLSFVSYGIFRCMI